MADPEISKGGDGRCISFVVIYRKCTQRTICLLYGKRRHTLKLLSQEGATAPRPTPFESVTVFRYFQRPPDPVNEPPLLKLWVECITLPYFQGTDRDIARCRCEVRNQANTDILQTGNTSCRQPYTGSSVDLRPTVPSWLHTRRRAELWM